MNSRKEQLGKALAEAFPDKTKIILYTLGRILIILVICLAGVRGLSGLKEWFHTIRGVIIFFVIFVPSLLWGLFPLLHLKDKLTFYENGVVVNSCPYLLSELGPITFQDYSSGLKTEQYMKTELRNFNVTYIKRPKKAYNKAYMNQI